MKGNIMTSHTLPRLVVLISGSGSNLQAILDATSTGRLAAQVVLVVSNRKGAYGLVRAAQAGIPTLYFPLKPYVVADQGRDAYEAALAERVSVYQPDLIVMVGWMHVLGPTFLDRFPGKIINLHPALPGCFPGTGAIHRAYDAYQQGMITHSGCMVHYAISEVDAGPVIVEANVPIYPDDSLQTFEQRMHATEHQIIIAAIERVLTTQSCSV